MIERLECRQMLSAGPVPRGGVITTSFTTGPSDANAVAVQQDGKFVVGGTAKAFFGVGSDGDAALIRYNPDATPDLSFGTGGKVLLPRGPSIDDEVNALAIQGDGKILVAGVHADVQGNGEQLHSLLVRLNPDGTEDSSFDANVTAGFTSLGNIFDLKTLVLQPDGKLVVTGTVSGSDGAGLIAVVRFNSNGTPDPQFGTGGKVAVAFIPNVHNFQSSTAMVLQADGKLVIGGYAVEPQSGVTKFGILRLNANGSLDQGFGSGGSVVTSFTSYNDQLRGLAIAPDGKIVAAGFLDEGGLALWHDAIARYNPDGSLDQTFGTGGKRDFNIGGNDNLSAVAVNGDGSILAGGGATASSGFDGMALVRLRPDGSFDPAFGNAGISITQVGKIYSGVSAMALLGDGRIVAAGQFAAGPAISTNDQFAVGLFTADGKNDPTFGVPYDINHDASVDFGDLLTIGQNYGRPGAFATGDLNSDASVGFDDVLILAQNYGNTSAFAAGRAAATDLLRLGAKRK